ncbi:hypothetical protein GCM10010121_093350 [Streptomyces brasiliensis]|uniref:Uncharacterized protein n=1 Tax=Streptomyces brasiliensis TaxID=1954 RepID=A0A917P9V4_9ACTN|nr:hypothetical protein GCM10010121_093350 [Streptomyces brasiliensis]
MRRRRRQPPVRYAVTESQGAHQVVDQLHGYALSSHTTRPAAEAAARELASSPAAAVTAAEALDAAQSGPAAAERRTLRRYGYAWSLRQDEMLSLMREFSHHRLGALISDGHLAMVFSPAGQPYYTTPERFNQLSPRWVRDGEQSFPTTDTTRLERPRPALEANLVGAAGVRSPCTAAGRAHGRTPPMKPLELAELLAAPTEPPVRDALRRLTPRALDSLIIEALSVTEEGWQQVVVERVSAFVAEQPGDGRLVRAVYFTTAERRAADGPHVGWSPFVAALASTEPGGPARMRPACARPARPARTMPPAAAAEPTATRPG